MNKHFGQLMGAVLILAGAASAKEPIKALIVDGHNNHDWRGVTTWTTQILTGSDRFTVDVATAGNPAEFKPDFSAYDVIVLNYNGPDWPQETRDQFEAYVKKGGGVVVLHAADNSFPNWPAYNLMIGLGGWNGRNENSGPYVYYNDEGKLIRDTSPGPGGNHGHHHAFAFDVREPKHPIMKGLPARWMHPVDEIYERMRGPAENMTVLATAYADPARAGSGRHEPQFMTITFGKGRIFHSCPGHDIRAFQGLGFQVVLQRGTEWAATGKVTIPAPDPAKLPAEGEPATRDLAEI